MPLYEYKCDVCGHRFERIVKFSDPPLETCPSCGGHVQKLMSSPAFQFKGTGWYVTDYAKKDHTPAGKTGGGESDSSGQAQDEKGAKNEKAEKAEKAQGEKSDTKTEKSEKTDKTEKTTKSDTGGDKSGSASGSTSSSSAAPSSSASSTPPKKDS